jgi:putative glutamine amidotransferase
MSKPLVGVVSDVQLIGPHQFHTAGDKYLRALAQASDVVPVIIPALGDVQAIEHWVDHLDGLFMTGAYSMVDPARYDQERADKSYDYDDRRDTLSFELIHAVINNDLPLFGACRGLQDLNVVLGGSLHQCVHETAELNDHREDKTLELEQQYGDIHPVTLSEGGMLATITGCQQIQVNSLHSQGIDRLGKGLAVEALAEDGLVEAVRVEAMGFGLAVQWHPEWQIMENPKQKLLFEAFGEACRKR